MTINFNFKKYLKYIILFLLGYILLHSFTDVKAWSNLSDEYIVHYTTEDYEEIGDFLIKGDTDYLDDYLSQHYSITGFNDYYNRVKNKVATDLGYSSFDAFEQDYYYITDVWLSPTSYSTRYVQLSFFYCLRSSENAYRFALSMATTVRSSSTPTINTNQTYYTQFGAIYRTSSYYFYQQFEHLDNTTFDSVTANSFGQHIMTCQVDSTYCDVVGYNSNEKTLSIQFKNADGRFLHYVDSNKPQLDLYFAKVNAMLGSTDFVFQKATIGNAYYTIYNLIEPISFNVLNRISINPENVQQFPNDALGVKVNTIYNSLLSNNNENIFSTYCSNDRPFVNNVCYLYKNDLGSYNDANSFNKINFYFSKNEISLQGNYKVVSFRLYTPYNLQITDASYTTNSTGNRYIPFTIISQQVVDYSLYRDYVVVLEPDSSSVTSEQLTSISFSFSNLTNFISVIPDDLSFGVFNTIKISSYNDLPTSSDIEQEISNNPISTISNNDNSSFFSNFYINDRGLSSFILLPLNYISNFKNSSCSSITLPIPHINNFTLPCVSSFMTTNVPTIWTLYKLLINGFIIYRLVISLFSDIKNIYKPDNDRIEVLDL